MFTYSKKIDAWSKEMIKDLDGIWGLKIPQNKNNSKNITLDFLISYLNKYLNTYGKIIISRFNNLTGLSYTIKDFHFYINSTPVSLHNTEKMYISLSQSHAFNKYPTTIIHEISHIYFYKYVNNNKFLKFNNITKPSELISKEEMNELKEIITVIINDEFRDIIDRLDEGYPKHKNIREQTIKLWNKKGYNFDKWIKEVIKIYKN